MRVVDFWERRAERRSAVEEMLNEPRNDGGRKATERQYGGSYTLQSYRSQFWDEEDDFKCRGVTITIRHQDALVGVARFREWQVPHFADPIEFYRKADDNSLEEADMAVLLGSYWQWHEDWPPAYGNIVLFQRLGIDSRADGARRALRLLGDFIGIEFARRASVMLMKAFPLEFEGDSKADFESRNGRFIRRLTAMQRLYHSTLQSISFGEQDQFRGWMWRPLRYCPEPLPVPDINWMSGESSAYKPHPLPAIRKPTERRARPRR